MLGVDNMLLIKTPNKSMKLTLGELSPYIVGNVFYSLPSVINEYRLIDYLTGIKINHEKAEFEFRDIQVVSFNDKLNLFEWDELVKIEEFLYSGDIYFISNVFIDIEVTNLNDIVFCDCKNHKIIPHVEELDIFWKGSKYQYCMLKYTGIGNHPHYHSLSTVIKKPTSKRPVFKIWLKNNNCVVLNNHVVRCKNE